MRKRRRTKRKRGGGIFSGEIVSPETPDRWQKREESRRKCMVATKHKLSYEKLIKKCGRTDDVWSPSWIDSYKGITPVNLSFYYSNEYDHA